MRYEKESKWYGCVIKSLSILTRGTSSSLECRPRSDRKKAHEVHKERNERRTKEEVVGEGNRKEENKRGGSRRREQKGGERETGVLAERREEK